jgi:uncharacterized protein YbaA (DUF1428 family)
MNAGALARGFVDFALRRSSYRQARHASRVSPAAPPRMRAASRASRPASNAPCTRSFLMSYVDGFVLAVPTAKRDTYRQLAEIAATIFKENGALQVVECWGDDVPEGKLTSFPLAVKRNDDETVVFSWVRWPSRSVRDTGMKAVMADPRLQPDKNPMPFDGKRMIYGGFEVIVDR